MTHRNNHIWRGITRIVLTAAMTATAVLLSSCGDFLEESSQDQDYIRTWNDLNELLVGSCYMTVNNTSYYSAQPTSSETDGSGNYGMLLHLIGDEVEEFASQGVSGDWEGHYRMFGAYTWQQRVGQNDTYTDYFCENYEWTKCYNAINVANNVLGSIDEVSQSNEEERKGVLKVSGEAHFLRAYYYFWLVNLYGKPYNPATAQTDPGVPVKTSDEVDDQYFARNSVQEVYDQVLADLLDAERELTEYGTAKKSIYRADSTAVNLLLSRVYLYMQNWDKAAEYARKVISSHPALQNLNTDNSKIMRKGNTENIFSMGGDDLPSMFSSGYYGLSVSQGLYNSYSSNDRRKDWYWQYGTFIGDIQREEGSRYTERPSTDNYQFYFYQYNDGLRGTESPVSSIFWMRSAEAYLNLAEAEAYLGNEQEAKEPLLKLMQNRYAEGSQELNLTSVSDSSLVSLIRNERRRELALQGQRWFDLRRYRVCQVYPSKISISHDYTYYTSHTSNIPRETRRYVLNAEDNSWTLPIPQSVLDFNVGMENNGNQYREYTVVRIY